jgi:hypothetical protein
VRPLLVLLVLGVGVGLRAFRLGWGLPGYGFPDAVVHFLRPAMAAVAGDGSLPKEFVHPPVLFYLLRGAFGAWSAAIGRPPHLAGALGAADLATCTLIGRATMLALAAASILVLHSVGRRLLGPRAALLAAACFALSPLHVLESHRVAPDVPMLLLLLAATRLALVEGPHAAGARLLAFGAGGLAAATKYTGVFALAVPAWTTLRAAPAGARRTLLLLAAGGTVAALGFAVGCLPCWTRFDAFARSLRLIASFGYLVGMPGVDLAEGWMHRRWLYPLVVALPYMTGWAVYLAALAGLVLLAASNRRAAGVLLAAVGPYLLFMGGSVSAVPRYYLFLAPFLALAAGAALDRLWAVRLPARAGPLLALAVLAYTGLLAGSQVMRLGLGPQREVGALVTELLRRENRRLVFAYPNRIALHYDAVRPFLPRGRLTIVEFPAPYANLAAEPVCDGCAATVRAQGLAWFGETAVDVLVLPSWVENTVRRGRPEGWAAHFFRELEAGTFGLRLAGHFRTRYLTERLYTWSDPMLDTHWETAIAGYKVFVRAEDP